MLRNQKFLRKLKNKKPTSTSGFVFQRTQKIYVTEYKKSKMKRLKNAIMLKL